MKAGSWRIITNPARCEAADTSCIAASVDLHALACDVAGQVGDQVKHEVGHFPGQGITAIRDAGCARRPCVPPGLITTHGVVREKTPKGKGYRGGFLSFGEATTAQGVLQVCELVW